MLSGQIPFLSMQNTAMLSTNEITRHLTLTGKIWNNVSQEAKELVQGNVSFKFCYSGQLNSRPTIARNNNKTNNPAHSGAEPADFQNCWMLFLFIPNKRVDVTHCYRRFFSVDGKFKENRR